MCATYYARTSDHGYETCAEHLAMAGCLAGGFAKGFGYLDDGLMAGLVHDLGKYSDAFQRRIRDPDHCGPVDHSTAGALLLMRHACPLAAMAVAGHHAGLPDLGSYGELEGSTFMSRMNRARRAGDRNPLTLAQAGEAQLDIPQSAFLHGTRSAKPMTSGKRPERWSLYTDMMLTRMLFSALVDADRLDAEFFTANRVDRAEHHILESLKQRLGPQDVASGRVPAFDTLREASLTVSAERDAEDRSRIDRLAAIMEDAANGYLAAPDQRPIDVRRCELLERCLARGKDPSYGTGLYTLTAPTGSGKTISSIAFALEHARTNNLRRVIYVIPYTSIIDQTVGRFEAIFGTDAVLPHYSEAPYQLKNESDMDATDLRRALAAENWNAPIVVTTAVQFFESLYSNATSRCRKLHNIADSVIVFDEAQTLPVPYLRPCVRAIAELVERYSSTAVLCTATQPELQPLLDESFDGDHVCVPEISPFTRDDRDSFRRVTIERLGDIALDALAERLGGHKQVLCVVNTRSKAQYLHDRLADDDAEGSFCLTTLQCAADRQRLFAEIRDRLDAGSSCRVVSTSLIEAGVDVDFPVAYREEAGLDSVIQTAGRCNREGRRPASESVVHVFSTEGGCAPFLRQNIAAFRAVADRHADLNTDEAVRAYFAEALCLRGGAASANVVNDALDRHRILPLHGHDENWPFATIAKRFRLIDTPTIPVYIPLPGEGSLLCERLERGDMDRTLFRKLGRYAVNVWPRHLEQLKSVGAVLAVGPGKSDEEDCFVLRDMGLYSSRLGLKLDGATADGIFV
ncbi:CRISPR-associated helicase Cas3' [Bifidobacterium bifidum]|uniref:CRISPR-associated helicase Cas3' n=1 Tax=Bifidobacterium bifidum TaxID=1681 RepID=UPI0012AB41E7|nr:CRISPR-associated helicase Cas3' [Bifidobacterium bifidum]